MDPASELDGVCDVVVEHGLIERIGPGAGDGVHGERVREIDGSGCWLLPALVDLRSFLREPGFEYKEDIRSGLLAAAAGGFAHVCAMPNTHPVNDTRAVTELMLRKAELVGGPRLHPIAAMTRGLDGKELTEMAELKGAGVVAVSDGARCLTNTLVMRRALEYASNFDLLVIQHAEDHSLTDGAQMHEGRISTELGLRGWPRIAEDVIVARDVRLAEHVDAPYHAAHVSTAGAIEIIRDARSRGVRVSCDVTPNHLILTDEAVRGYDTSCKVVPPLRERADVEVLREALRDGTIDAVVTDHAPHTALEKDCEFELAAPGIMGLELCFSLMRQLVAEDVLDVGRLVTALSMRPAELIGLAPPRLAAGATAELTLVDPEAKWVPAKSALRTKSRNTPFLNTELTGKVVLTLCNGRIAYEGSELRS